MGVRLDPRTAQSETSVGTVQQFIVQSGEGIRGNWRQTREAEGSGTEGCSGYQGRDDEDGSGTSRVETKQSRK